MTISEQLTRAPAFQLTDDQREFRRTVRQFVESEIEPLDLREYEWRDDPERRIPWEVVDAADELGLKDLTAPEEYGGRDASTLELCLAVEELAAGDLGVAVIFDQCWKIAKLIDERASDELREQFFSEFTADPRHLLAVCGTERNHGSNHVIPNDEMQFETTAEKDGDEWVINGHKRYISNGADAKTYVVRVQTDEDAPAVRGSTSFLVPHDADRVKVTRIWEKVSQRLVNNATVEFDDVRVSEENVLGELHRSMSGARKIPHAGHTEAGASTLGVARAALETAYDYAGERRQGGTEIINHQSVGHDLAEMATRLQAARSLIWTAARAVDESDEYDYPIGSMAKVFAADTSMEICKRSLEIFGGAGIMMENRIQKYLRDSLSFLHSDGTQRAHKEKIMNAVRGDKPWAE